MGEVGFEPTNSLRGQIYSLLPLTARPFARHAIENVNFYKKQIFCHSRFQNQDLINQFVVRVKY